MYRLVIHRIVDGTDNWPAVDIIEAVTTEECLAIAERKYNQDDYHWTTPIEVPHG